MGFRVQGLGFWVLGLGSLNPPLNPWVPLQGDALRPPKLEEKTRPTGRPSTEDHEDLVPMVEQRVTSVKVICTQLCRASCTKS